MLAWMIFGSMALLISAPLAIACRNGAAGLRQEAPATFAFCFAFLAFDAVIAGLLARSPFTAQAFEAVEVAAMLGAGASILIGLLSVARLRFAHVSTIAIAAVLGGYLILRVAGLNDQAAASCAWMLATLGGLAVALTRGVVARRDWLGTPSLVLAFAFIPVHVAQLAQVLAQGQLKAAVPAASLIGIGLIGAIIADRISRKRSPAYARSGLDHGSAQDLFGKIEQFMASRKLYLRYQVRREDLARELGTSPRAVGEAINRCRGMSFSAYLRELRTAEAERLFVDPGNRGVALEALGMQAGFKSRSALYTAFIGTFGVSPGERRAALENNRDRA